jgi:probable addiction module antidote protein
VHAAGYLTAALEEGEEVFLLAVRNVVKAQGGMQSLSRDTGLNRESLYTMLSDHGNPMFSSVRKVLDGLGFRVQVAPKLRGSRAA